VPSSRQAQQVSKPFDKSAKLWILDLWQCSNIYHSGSQAVDPAVIEPSKAEFCQYWYQLLLQGKFIYPASWIVRE
jgi:hypothetical protein